MKVRKYGSGGSIGRVKSSTDVNENGGAGVGGTGSRARSKSLVSLRNIRATPPSFPPPGLDDIIG